MHMRNKTIIIVFIIFHMAGYPCFSQKLLPELKASISLVDETWNILDEASKHVWPGWNNYRDISYFTAVPLKQDLLINPPLNPEDGFTLIDTKLDSIRIYLRDPGRREKVYGGGYRYRINGIKYRGVQFHPFSKEYSNKAFKQFSDYYSNGDSLRFKNLFYSKNFYIKIIVHEAFHLWQFTVVKNKLANEVRESSFNPNESFQLLAEKEGEVLSEAFLCNDVESLIELTKSFLKSRKERRKFLSDADII